MDVHKNSRQVERLEIVEINKAPEFAMIRVGGPTGGTIGLLVHDGADPSDQRARHASSERASTSN